MNLRNIGVPAGDANLVGLHQHLPMREAVRWFKTVGGKLNQKAHWSGEIDGVHEAPILNAAVLDLAFIQALYRLREGGARDRKGEVVHAAGLRRRPARIGFAVLIGEYRNESSIARIKVKMVFGC